MTWGRVEPFPFSHGPGTPGESGFPWVLNQEGPIQNLSGCYRHKLLPNTNNRREQRGGQTRSVATWQRPQEAATPTPQGTTGPFLAHHGGRDWTEGKMGACAVELG